jgi:hypothetical protein
MAFSGNAMCTSFKKELMEAKHNFLNSGGNTFRIPLYTNSAVPSDMGGSGSTMDASVTNYATNNEVANGNGYTTKGAALTRVDPSIPSGTTAITNFATSTLSSSTITARGAIIFNDSASNDASVLVLDFGSDKSSSSGDFSITFPTADASNAIIRIA